MVFKTYSSSTAPPASTQHAAAPHVAAPSLTAPPTPSMAGSTGAGSNRPRRPSGQVTTSNATVADGRPAAGGPSRGHVGRGTLLTASSRGKGLLATPPGGASRAKGLLTTPPSANRGRYGKLNRRPPPAPRKPAPTQEEEEIFTQASNCLESSCKGFDNVDSATFNEPEVIILNDDDSLGEKNIPLDELSMTAVVNEDSNHSELHEDSNLPEFHEREPFPEELSPHNDEPMAIENDDVEGEVEPKASSSPIPDAPMKNLDAEWENQVLEADDSVSKAYQNMQIVGTQRFKRSLGAFLGNMGAFPTLEIASNKYITARFSCIPGQPPLFYLHTSPTTQMKERVHVPLPPRALTALLDKELAIEAFTFATKRPHEPKGYALSLGEEVANLNDLVGTTHIEFNDQWNPKIPLVNFIFTANKQQGPLPAGHWPTKSVTISLSGETTLFLIREIAPLMSAMGDALIASMKPLISKFQL